MKLGDYEKLLSQRGLLQEAGMTEEAAALQVTGLTFDSSQAGPGTLFVCKGAHFKEDYLRDALQRGAVAYVSEHPFPQVEGAGTYFLVDRIREAMAVLGNAFYQEPWRKLKTVGITGTKGKSTTVYFLRWILDHYLERVGKPRSGVISSIDTYDGVVLEESHLTTPEAIPLQKHFANAVNSGIEYLEMEVSSQALKYDRVSGITFDVGVFLNIGEDHISDVEHKDFNDYFESKLRLFSQCRTACVNLNSNHLEEIMEAALQCQRVVTFGTDQRADVFADRVVKQGAETVFQVRTPRYQREIRLGVPGFFNVENALGAIAVCEVLEIPEEDVAEGLRQARVSGRMESFLDPQGKVMVIVDYAHNRMSFENLFTSTLREYPDRKIYAVFGCPGGKALGRREELPEVAGRYAVEIFLTEEDAGEEPLEEICGQLAANVKRTGCPCQVVLDRGEAIRRCIAQAREGEGKAVILLTGKGRETRQKRGTRYEECPSDVEYVERYL